MPRERPAALLALALACLLPLASCTSGPFARDPEDGAGATPLIDRNAASTALLASYFETLEQLVQSQPAEQAEILVGVQREYDAAPTPSHQLRYALVLAVPGHAGTDLVLAQRLLRELVATPETLLPPERALAFLELQKVDNQLTLSAENRRLQASAAQLERERLTAANRKLQAEVEENGKLRKELAEARAKLEAIANIERSLNERKPSTEGRSP